MQRKQIIEYIAKETKHRIYCKENKAQNIMYPICSMYDVDGNGWIDLEEMTKLVGSIYKMIGTQQPHLVQNEAVKEKARGIFEVMDINSDGKVTKEEFTKTCLEDKTLIDLLTPASA